MFRTGKADFGVASFVAGNVDFMYTCQTGKGEIFMFTWNQDPLLDPSLTVIGAGGHCPIVPFLYFVWSPLL